MSQAPRDPSKLERIAFHEVVLRFIDRIHCEFCGSPPRPIIKKDAVPRTQFRPTSSSYGPSVFVESRLANGADSVRAAKPAWQDHYVVPVTAGRIEDQGVDVKVCYTPEDCEIVTLKPAHASLIGITGRPIRDRIIALWNRSFHAQS